MHEYFRSFCCTNFYATSISVLNVSKISFIYIWFGIATNKIKFDLCKGRKEFFYSTNVSSLKSLKVPVKI